MNLSLLYVDLFVHPITYRGLNLIIWFFLMQTQLLCWWLCVTLLSLALWFSYLTLSSCRATGWMSRDAPFLPHWRYNSPCRDSIIHMMRSLSHNFFTISCSARQADYFSSRTVAQYYAYCNALKACHHFYTDRASEDSKSNILWCYVLQMEQEMLIM